MKNPDPDYDRAALVMGVAPFGANFKDPEYRAIKTKQYTYIKTPEGASNLFDNLKDPYQMDNLLNKPEFENIQNELDSKLNDALKYTNDEFKTREFYLEKWNYVFDENKNAIDYWSFDKGNGVVQSPKPIAN
jgi:hypothetical protein